MRRDMTNLTDAIRERRLRAVEVRQRYIVEFAGMQAYVVTEPEDFDRSYLVSLLDKTCTCPDYGCQEDKESENHLCKHCYAVAELTGTKIGDAWEKRAEESLSYMAKTKVVVDGKLDDEVYTELTPEEKKQFSDAMSKWAARKPDIDPYGD